jgi:hypothetical protein
VAHSQGQASTEDLRTAMIHFRALFDDLVHEKAPAPDAAPPVEQPVPRPR